jgi:hypothetical protein
MAINSFTDLIELGEWGGQRGLRTLAPSGRACELARPQS